MLGVFCCRPRAPLALMGFRAATAPEMVSLWQTAGVQYQMFHVLALLSVIVAANRQL